MWYNVVFAYVLSQCVVFSHRSTMYIKAQRMERKNTTKDNVVRSQLRSDISRILTRSPKRILFCIRNGNLLTYSL